MNTVLTLASKSQSRRAMLDAARVEYEAIAADIDERAIEAKLADAEPSAIAATLSLAKAKAIAALHPDTLVLGSDSLVAMNGKRYDKPTSRENAAQHLRAFSGNVMELHSAAALVRGNECVWSHASLAKLYVRELSDAFIDTYLDAEWPEISYCAGAFRIEAMGVQLFERIEGDQFTVLGMPLMPLLGALRKEGILQS